MGFFTKKSNGKADAAKPGSLSDSIPSLASTKPPSAAAQLAPEAAAVPAPSHTGRGAAPVAVRPAATTQVPPPAAARASQASTSSLPLEELAKRKAQSQQVSAAFGQIVSLLMRDPKHKHLSLADLEWLAVPPLLAGQFSIAEAQSKSKGSAGPVAVILWARVSPDIDTKLTGAGAGLTKLRPSEWTSGDIYWIIRAIGDERLLATLLKGQGATQWKTTWR